MIKVVICDDDDFDIETAKKYLVKYIAERKEDIVFELFNSSCELLENLNEGKYYDIYLLDIMMAGLDGIELGKEIRKHQEHAFIIYLSVSEDYALESYQVTALHYLLKPIEEKAFFLALDKAFAQISHNESKITIRTKRGIAVLPVHQIVYAEYLNHSVKYHTAMREDIISIVTREPFSETIKALMQDDRFLRCHQSFVVNMKYVKEIDKKEFRILDGSTVPISSSLYAHTKNSYLNYLLRTR